MGNWSMERLSDLHTVAGRAREQIQISCPRPSDHPSSILNDYFQCLLQALSLHSFTSTVPQPSAMLTPPPPLGSGFCMDESLSTWNVCEGAYPRRAFNRCREMYLPLHTPVWFTAVQGCSAPYRSSAADCAAIKLLSVNAFHLLAGNRLNFQHSRQRRCEGKQGREEESEWM